MSSLWPPARASLDGSFAVLREIVEELKAAKSVDIAEVVEQLAVAAESSRDLRALVSSELPGSSWQTREQLDALLKTIRERKEERATEQLRSRLLALATELERGTIVHRRAVRIEQVNQLRDQAIQELRSQAAPGEHHGFCQARQQSNGLNGHVVWTIPRTPNPFGHFGTALHTLMSLLPI